MGLCFNRENLNLLLEATKKFKNSVFIVYDKAKANYGLNPLHAYRLSEKAISTFKHDHGVVLPILLQEKIAETKLTIEEMFEEISIKVVRSHMQQAYLFDQIQPEMPAFNTNMFKLASPAYLESHVHIACEEAENLHRHEQDRQDNVLKAYQKLKQNKINASNFTKTVAQSIKEETNLNKMEYLLLAKQVSALCDQVTDSGIGATTSEESKN